MVCYSTQIFGIGRYAFTHNSCHNGQPGSVTQCDSVCTGQNRTMQRFCRRRGRIRMDFIIEGSLAFTEFHILSTSNVLLHLYLEHISRGTTSNVTLYLNSPPPTMSASDVCQFKSNITSHRTNAFGTRYS